MTSLSLKYGLTHTIWRSDVFNEVIALYKNNQEQILQKLFDGSSLLCPVLHPETDMSLLLTMGFVISHAYMVTGILPVRIAFPCLAHSLLGTSETVPESAIVEAFQDSLSTHDSNIFKNALEEAAATYLLLTGYVWTTVFAEPF